MHELRCGTCGKKLGEGIYQALRIKCTRCKTMNYLRAESTIPEHLECQNRDTQNGNLSRKKSDTA